MQVRQRHVDGVEDAAEVDRDRVDVRLRLGRAQRADAGLGDDAVQPAELGDAVVDGGGEGGPVAHVGYPGHRAPAVLFHQARVWLRSSRLARG